MTGEAFATRSLFVLVLSATRAHSSIMADFLEATRVTTASMVPPPGDSIAIEAVTGGAASEMDVDETGCNPGYGGRVREEHEAEGCRGAAHLQNGGKAAMEAENHVEKVWVLSLSLSLSLWIQLALEVSSTGL